MDKFWMVMRLPAEGGKVQPPHLRPANKHFRAADAFAEAKRLAFVHPGESFAVMVAFTIVTLPFEIKQTKTAPDNPDATNACEIERGREMTGF